MRFTGYHFPYSQLHYLTHAHWWERKNMPVHSVFSRVNFLKHKHLHPLFKKVFPLELDYSFITNIYVPNLVEVKVTGTTGSHWSLEEKKDKICWIRKGCFLIKCLNTSICMSAWQPDSQKIIFQLSSQLPPENWEF